MIGRMPTFAAFDGTELAFHEIEGGAAGHPLICVPGGPMRDSRYLGDLGGLSEHRRLVLLDPRGTGASAVPSDLSSYRCDRLVDDLEALREHLELERLDLLGHSAGTNLAIMYAARYPQHVDRLVLVTPSAAALGLTVTAEARLDIARLRTEESWFGAAYPALQRIVAGHDGGGDDWSAIDPFYYGRWDAAAQAHRDAGERHQNDEAAAVFAAEGAFDPEATAIALAAFAAPTLFIAGAVDLNSPPTMVVELAESIPGSRVAVQAAAGHFPWLDDAHRFASTVEGFLRAEASARVTSAR